MATKQVFDGAAFLRDNGLELVDVGDKPGVVKVLDTYGQQGEVDINKMLAAEGVDPASIDPVYNDPTAPIQRSPVAFTDRVKMSLGNAKGQINYLKANYQDAQLTEDGDMLVKDKGAWYAVDPRGLGDGSGWDVAAELAADVLGDTVGDAALITGQIGGAAAAGTVGLAAGPAAVAAAAAGGVAGTAAAKGITTALGRIVGTYDATPDEQLKDIALEGVLALAGEGVALGAKHAVVPALKAAAMKLGSAAPAVKSMLAETISQTTGAKAVNAARLLDRPQFVTGQMDALLKTAAESGEALTDSSLLAASKRRSMTHVTDLLSGAQDSLSAEWRKQMGAVIKAVPDNVQMDIRGPVTEAFQSISELGLLKVAPDGLRTIPVPPREVAKKLAAAGVDELTAMSITKKLAAWSNAANSALDGQGILKGQEGVRKLLEVNKAFDDFYYNLIDGRPQLQQFVVPISDKLRNGMLATLPGDVGKQVAAVKSFYKAHKPIVEMAEREARSGPAAIEGVANRLYSAGADQVSLRDGIRSLAKLKGEQGQVAADMLEDALAAHDFIKIAPRGAVGASTPRLAAAAGAGLMFGPAAGLAAAGAVSPRMTAKTVATGAKAMAAFNKMVRGLGDKNRQSFLQSPELVNAALTEVLRTVQEDRSRR